MAIRNLVGAMVLCGLVGLLIRIWPTGSVELGAAWLGITSAESPRPAAARGPVARAAARAAVPADALRVLFVGNSHTFYNDMPQLVARLATAAQVERPPAFVMEARGGETLAGHLSRAKVRQLLSQHSWDYVVLQEQQQRPTFTWNPEQIEREFYAPARTLDVLVRAAGARTVLYMTWARRDGDPENVPGDSYEPMQERGRQGYMNLAGQLEAIVAPVGVAWRALRERRPDLPLWMPDGSHPALHGSYLAACVLFAALYGRSPLGNPYTAGLPPADARVLQEAAEAARPR